MSPNNPQSPSGEPNHLPPVAADQPMAPVPAPPAALPPASADAAAQYAAKAKQVIAQYGNDPYRLGEALNQLKSGYLAQQHHITTNQTGI